MTALGVKGLIVLVADTHMESTMNALLARPADLGLACFDFLVENHPHSDPGCLNDAEERLRHRLGKYRYCIVMFDYDGSGSKESREETQERVEKRLGRNGWDDRAKVIVIQPELEAWVWGDLATASAVLGWGGDRLGMRARLTERGLWPDGHGKPPRPKKAMSDAMEGAPGGRRIRKNARMFGKMATVANMDKCRDPAFRELLATLRRWFPPQDRPA